MKRGYNASPRSRRSSPPAMVDTPRMVGPDPATGILGVGTGDGVGDGPGVAVGSGVPVGVGVGLGPGVLVGVGPGVPVGVGVGVLGVMVNTSLQLVLTAFGVTCGTVGATDCWFSSLVDVKYATAPIPTVMTVTKTRYQYFFTKFILFPCVVDVYFCLYDKIRYSARHGVVQRKLTACVCGC